MPIDAPPLASELAREIASQGILLSWPYLAWVLVASFLGGAAGSFIKAYFTRRGETLATKADFDLILDQLRASTRATEETRAEVEAAFGDASSRRTLLREKIEEFFRKLEELDLWTRRLREAAIGGEHLAPEANPIASIRMLSALYFREIERETLDLHTVVNDLVMWSATQVWERAQAVIDRRPEPQIDTAALHELIRRQVIAAGAVGDRLVALYAPRAGL